MTIEIGAWQLAVASAEKWEQRAHAFAKQLADADEAGHRQAERIADLESKLAAREGTITQLRQYVQHKKDCGLMICQACHGDFANGRHSWIAGSGEYWHPFIPGGTCSCGLDAALQSSPSQETP